MKSKDLEILTLGICHMAILVISQIDHFTTETTDKEPYLNIQSFSSTFKYPTFKGQQRAQAHQIPEKNI